MMSFLKGLVTGGPKPTTTDTTNLMKDDISHLFGQDELLNILAAELLGSLTLYEVRPAKSAPLPGGVYQQRLAM